MSVGQESMPHVMQVAREHLEKGELQKAAKYFERAATESESSETTELKISCFLNAGACLISLGQYKKGLVCLTSAADIISAQSSADLQKGNEGDDKEMLKASADVHYNSAVAYQALRDYKKAVKEFQQCIDLYEKSGYLQNAADIFSTLALCHREAGQPESEMACLTRVQGLYKELGDNSGEAMTCAYMARAYLRVGRKEECKQMLSTAKMISLRMDDQKTLGRLHSQCGLVHSSLHQYNEALQSFERALPLVRAAGSSADSSLLEASLLQNIGVTYNEKRMYSESLVYHEEAASMHGKLENHTSEIKCLCNLAFAQSQLHNFTSSASTYTEALDKAQTIENLCLQFQACEGLGVCYYHMKQYTEAVGSFNSALELLDKMEEDTGIARERVLEKLSAVTEIQQRSTGIPSQFPSTNRATTESSQSPDPGKNVNRVPPDYSLGKKSQPSSSHVGRKGKGKKELTQTQPTTLQNQASNDLEIQAYKETLISSDENSDREQSTSGPNAKETYTIQHSNRGKEIESTSVQQEREAGTNQRDTSVTAQSLTANSFNYAQHSKLCTIL